MVKVSVFFRPLKLALTKQLRLREIFLRDNVLRADSSKVQKESNQNVNL